MIQESAQNTNKVIAFRKSTALLADLEWKLGQVLHVVAPTLWVKLTRKAQVPGFEGEGHFVRGSLIHDLNRNHMVPELQAVRQLSPGRRLVAIMNVFAQQYTVAVGQRIPIVNLKNKIGFKEASFNPELQIGVDMHAMAPTVKLLVSDDDYKGWALQPKHHPLVVLAGGGLYWSMMKYRFPISAAIDVAKFKTEKGDMKLQLVTTTKRIDNNRISTTNVSGVVLCMNV